MCRRGASTARAIDRPLPAGAVVAEPVSEIAVDARVVDGRRFPVAGATVELFDGSVRRTATSDAAGRVRFVLAASSARRTVELHARDADDARVAVLRASVRWSDRDLGTLVLAPSSSLSVEVVDDGRPVARARVQASVWPVRGAVSPWGRGASFDARTDDRGVAAFRIPPGEVELDARFGDRRGRLVVVAPRDGIGPHRIELGPTRTIDVRVVSSPSGEPVAGATVGVWLRENRRVGGSSFMLLETPYRPSPPVAPTDTDG